MDIWSDRRKSILCRNLSGGNALFYLCNACVVRYPGIQLSAFFGRNSYNNIFAGNLLPVQGVYEVALYSFIDTCCFSDHWSGVRWRSVQYVKITVDVTAGVWFIYAVFMRIIFDKVSAWWAWAAERKRKAQVDCLGWGSVFVYDGIGNIVCNPLLCNNYGIFPVCVICCVRNPSII